MRRHERERRAGYRQNVREHRRAFDRVVLIGLVVIAWLTIVFRGYLPEGVNTALTYVNGLDARVFGYAAILTDDYPPVGLERSNGTPAGTPAPVAPNV